MKGGNSSGLSHDGGGLVMKGNWGMSKYTV